MTSEQTTKSHVPSYEDFPPGTYTALRLQHASVEHLNLTTRRCFIGPIPEGWLKSHRKSWYRGYLDFSSYSSRAATFTAAPSISHRRQITGLGGPSVSATFANSFPQPDDADDDDGLENEDEEAESSAAHDDSGSPSPTIQDADSEAIREGAKSETGPKRQKKPQLLTGDKPAADLPQDGLSFVTAPAAPKRIPKSKSEENQAAAKSPPPGSFVTAKESFPPKSPPKPSNPINGGDEDGAKAGDVEDQQQDSSNSPSLGTQNRFSNGALDQSNSNGSTTQLLPTKDNDDLSLKGPHLQKEAVQDEGAGAKPKVKHTGLVKFNLDEDTTGTEDRVLNRTASKIGQAGRRRIWKRMRKGTAHPGQIVKMEKMLVRVDTTRHELPPDFDENDSLEIEARTIEKWREFVLVCRESTTDDYQFVLQFYKTRVIPARVDTHVQKHCTHEIALSHKNTHVNLYSSLDKTLVLWLPSRRKSETLIYILRAHSAANAVEWYTFFRSSLGWQRSDMLQVHVPDLSVTLQLHDPFGDLENSMNEAQKSLTDDALLAKTMEAEKAVAHSIINRSLKVLENNPEWATVLATWLSRERIGLAWKRYDRLEWVHGSNEQRMYGSMAMQQTHDLELRPKAHYPTNVIARAETTVEPAPVEGFLIRLTSRKGSVKKFGKLYYKRLYFTTHNQFLCYTRPAKALPPPPPKAELDGNGNVPSASEIVEKSPLIFAVKPYPDDNQDGEVDWLQYGTPAVKERRDREAYKESERQVNTLLNAEGYVNLAHAVRVQNYNRGSSPADAKVDNGSDIDFHEEVADTAQNDGKTESLDDKRTFEIVLRNGMTIRLQAYNENTKKEWMHRLRDLIHYWKLRLAHDLTMLKAVRGTNLRRLDIDEEQEAYLGQFGEKWEVTRSIASPKLFNMCGISSCRAITMSGVLYYKPRRHTTFVRSGVILCHGRLLIFQGITRTSTGQEIKHIQHNRTNSIRLQDCYIYSGLITGDDLLYQSESFDSAHPGHNALPKVYLSDGWTSQDEDTMTCFVIWQPRNKSWFKANEEETSDGKTKQKLRHVSRLGATGRSIVFITRSRAERDHWVMSIGMEIERLQAGEDIRVVDNP